MSIRHALIIGGGIAGPVTAMFLQKAGISAAIYEARSAVEEASSGLQIAPNGMNVLKAIGIDGKVADAGCITSHICFRNSQGRVLSRVENGNPKHHGAPAVTITRSALHQVLISEAISRGIPVCFGKRLIGLDDHPDDCPDGHPDGRPDCRPKRPVHARFEDGTSAEGDIIIGADGIWSAVRRLAMPEAPNPVYTGLLGVGGIAPLTNSPCLALADLDSMTMTWGPAGFFGYGTCRLRSGKAMLWWSNQPQEVPPTREELKSASQDELRRRLMELHRGWHEPIVSLIESTEEVQRIAIYEMPSLPAWHRGRAVLIGDAAHAMATSAGQGASQALEDGMLLARLLRDQRGSIEETFAAFEQQRRSRVEKISAIARRNSDRKKPLGPLGLRIRDFLVAHLLPVVAGRSWNAMYAYKIDW